MTRHEERRRSPRWVVLTTALLAAVSSASHTVVKAQGAVVNGISPDALAQIDALLREKLTRTPAQRKLDSHLVFEIKMTQGQAIANGVARLQTDLPYQPDGRLMLDVKAQVTDAFLTQLSALGAEILHSDAAYGSVRLLAALGRVESIAALPEVIFVQPKQEAMTSRLDVVADRQGPAGDRRLRRRLNRQKLAAAVQSAIASSAPVTQVGSQNSEGDLTHRAAFARTTYSVDGTGVKVGVLSDGVSNLAGSQALGDLGPVTVLPGQTGSGDEGTAMLEIIHDLAPGAQLFFATAFNGVTSFAQNIRDLRTAGCDIIVDDVFYFSETPFQDGQSSGVLSTTNGGVVIQAVKDVTAAGALYFSSAGNSGNLNDNTSGVWEGDFVDGGAVGPPISGVESGQLHAFPGPQNFNPTTANSGNPINLYWSDPLGASTNDYDLFRLNSTGTTILAASTNFQTGTQDPFEFMSGNSTSGDRIVIVKFAGVGRFLHLNTNRGRLSIKTSGQTHGHAAVNSALAFGVAATPAGPGAGSTGPYPNPFNSSNVVETFSSDGFRRIFYQNDGTVITPGNVSSTGGQVLNKPDITAADGVHVSGVGNFPSAGCSPNCVFYGTSAAAPHAGAIAALVKSRNLSLTGAQVRTALTSTAIDIEAAGFDRDSGAGIAMADTAVGSVCAFSISPASASYNASGGGGSVTVTTQTGCAWTAASNDGFIVVTGGASGTGNGTVTYTVAVNIGAANVANAARSGTVTIAGKTFTVNQTGCTYAIAPTGQVFGSSTGSGSVTITTPAACLWTVTGIPAWASTTSGGSGTGPGSWNFTVVANTGPTRSQTVTVAGQPFSLTQLATALKLLVSGTRATFTLTGQLPDQYLASIEMVGGRSYCGQVVPGRTSVTQATPTLAAFRADGTTSLGSGVGTNARVCFIAPASESARFQVSQADTGSRLYRLGVFETTLWANWFFVGTSYSSYTLLRNTTTSTIAATITWRDDTGAAVGSMGTPVPGNGTVILDARGNVGSAIVGSVEVAHDGPPQGLVGSQTTLSGVTGLSFDTLMFGRIPR